MNMYFLKLNKKVGALFSIFSSLRELTFHRLLLKKEPVTSSLLFQIVIIYVISKIIVI
jgi:hypothetical protein